MSFSAIKWAFKQPVSPTEKLVLLCIADHAHEKTQQCWPSVATIASESGYSRRTVFYAIESLVELGFISRDERFNRNRQTSNRYTVNVNFKPKLKLIEGCNICTLPRAVNAPPGVLQMHTESFHPKNQPYLIVEDTSHRCE